jgi:hypothetical protein
MQPMEAGASVGTSILVAGCGIDPKFSYNAYPQLVSWWTLSNPGLARSYGPVLVAVASDERSKRGGPKCHDKTFTVRAHRAHCVLGQKLPLFIPMRMTDK